MKIIKLIAVAALLISWSSKIYAQEISVRNIWAEEQNSSIAVHYTLVAEKPADVILQYSIDNGRTWFDCKSVTGDLQSQMTGFKTIIWDCRQDGFEKGNLLFNVIANKKPTQYYKKNAFGMDLGIGTRNTYYGDGGRAIFDVGIRWIHNFSPYIGLEIVNLRFKGDVKGDSINKGLLQAMSGLRVYTSNFTKNMKGYASIKIGYSYQLGTYPGGQFTFETEAGVYLTKNLFTGFVYNPQYIHTGPRHESSMCHYVGWRIGYEF